MLTVDAALGLVVMLLPGNFGSSSHSRGCEAAIQSIRRVWWPGGGFLPLYNDAELIAYLNSAARQWRGRRRGTESVPVLPVLSKEPLAFGSSSQVYVSTSLLLQLKQPEELARVVENAAYRRRQRSRAAFVSCAHLTSFRSFSSVKSRLARQLAAYDEFTRPKLRLRTSAFLNKP